MDTVAASTPKGALLHRMIRTGRALFTAHTNADAAAPGVSDALAEALGATVEDVLDPAPGGPDLDKWVIFAPVESAEAVRAAVFAAGAGQIGDYSCCSWGVTGTGQFLPQDGASPAIGEVGTVERVPEDRIEVIAPAGIRPRVLAAMRAAHPYEEPAFDVFALAPLRPGSGSGGSRGCRSRCPCASSSRGSARPCRAPRGGARHRRARPRGLAVGGLRRGGDSLLDRAAAAGVQAYLTADLRHHPADEHTRRSEVALIDVAHWASEYPWCAQAAGLLTAEFGDALPVRVSDIRTDPWTLGVN